MPEILNFPKLVAGLQMMGLPIDPKEMAEHEERLKNEEAFRAERHRADSIVKLTRLMGDRYCLNNVELDKYEIYDDRQKQVVSIVRRLGAQIEDAVRGGKNVLFVGTVGTGKDHLMAWLMYQACHLFSCHWANGQDIFGGFRDRIDTKESDEKAIRDLTTPKLLAISDPIPPAGNLGNWDIGNFYRIVEHRYRAGKSTWMSVNTQSRKDLEDRLSPPVFDRLQHGATILPCFWPSYRARKKG